MLNIYNYNNIIHNQTFIVKAPLPLETSQLNYYNNSWFVRFSIAQLIKSHAHLGGAFEEVADTSYWFLSSRKNNFVFIDMQYTLIGLRAGALAVKGTIRNYQKFAFINNDITSWGYTTEYANMAGEPYFIYQWVGGAITNIKKLWPMFWTKLENKTWNELSRRQCFIKMSLMGYRLMHSIPKLVFFNTIKYSVNAAAEAHAMFVGSFGLLDVDAHSVDPAVYLPSNDDSGLTLSYYNSIFCKLILKEKFQMVRNFIARKKLLRSIREHKEVNKILHKHMRTRALLELHHAENKWLHPVVWNTLKYTRNLFSFKMFPNLWDKSVVHKIFKSFHQIKYSFFAGKGKYSKAVKEYEKKIYRFYKHYLNSLFTIDKVTFKLNSINKALYDKFIFARKLFYLNLLNAYNKFSHLYKELIFVYKWMFDLEVDWYGPSLVNVFKKYNNFLKKAAIEIKKLKNKLKIYTNALNRLRANNKNFLYYKNKKILLTTDFVNLPSFFKMEDTWGDQFMPTKYKVLKLPQKKQKKQLFASFKQKRKKSNPKHSLFMRQYNYKYSSNIWKMRKRPWLPVKNPVYYVKEPHFFYTKQSLKKSKYYFSEKTLKRRADLYLTNFLPSFFKAFSQKKINFMNSFMYPNNFYNIMPKRYNVYSIYLSSRFHQKLWFLLMQLKKNHKNSSILNKLIKQFNLTKSSINFLYDAFLKKAPKRSSSFTIHNIYKNYILPSLPIKGQEFYESRGELDHYFEQIKLMSWFTNIGEDVITNISSTNSSVFFNKKNSIFCRTDYFLTKTYDNIKIKTSHYSLNIINNLRNYLRNIFFWKNNYTYKQAYKKISKANNFLNKIIQNKPVCFTGSVYSKIFSLDNKFSYNLLSNFLQNNFFFKQFLFPRVRTHLKSYNFLYLVKGFKLKKKSIKNLIISTKPKKSFYQMWLEKREKKERGIQNILNQDISFYMKKKRHYSKGKEHKKIDLANAPSLITELLSWNTQHSFKRHNKKNVNNSSQNYSFYKSNKFKRRRNFKYGKRINARFQEKSPYYIKQQRNFLRKNRQKFFRPFFSIEDKSLNYLESNIKNLINIQTKMTLQSFYFLIQRLLKKLKNSSKIVKKRVFYILLTFCYKIINTKTLYSFNFVTFIYKLVIFINKNLQLTKSVEVENFFKKLKQTKFNLFNSKRTYSEMVFKYKYFLDPYIKFHLWPYDFNKYHFSTFISFFWKKKNFLF